MHSKKEKKTCLYNFNIQLSMHMKQTITYLGSLCLNINNIMGPAIVAFPSIYAQSGWFLPTSLLLVVCVLSAFSSTMLCEAMQRIPGNHNLMKRYEFATTVKHYWGDKW